MKRKPMAVRIKPKEPTQLLTPDIFTTDRPRTNGERLLDYKWRRLMYEQNLRITHPDEDDIHAK